MYSSTIIALEPLYPKLSHSGYIIIDGLDLVPCVEAVNDYCKVNNIDNIIIDVDVPVRILQGIKSEKTVSL